MWEQGYITGEQYDQAYETPIKLAPYSPYQQVREPYVVDFVKQQLIDMFGKDRVFKGGLRVQTTIDPKWQELARKAIRSVLDRKNDPSAAIVSLDPNTGYIRAMASSGDYDKTKFNLAAQMHRQPGSAFKPFCLVAALEQGMNPATTVYRSGPQAIHIPGTNETWHVNNFSDGYYGASNLVEATIHSDNSIFAQLIMDVGVKNVVNVAKAMGIKSPINANPSIVLGGLTYGVSPLDMASAYGTMAAGGRHVEPTIITRVWDASGKLIFEAQPKVTQAISARTAFTATQILQLNIQRGTGKRADIGRPCAGKTGTASDFSDAWFAGYTPHLATAVWVGHPKGRVPMRSVHGISVTGGSFPAMIWHNFMYDADRTYPAGGFPGPSGIAAAGAPAVASSAGATTTDSTTTTAVAVTTRPRRTTTTAAPTTSPPTTSPPTTPPPTTSPPTTSPPTTSPPTTSPPTTSPPTTQPPTTAAPATATAPTDAVPATVSPPT
jgi:penicillin-binding protein 1A